MKVAAVLALMAATAQAQPAVPDAPPQPSAPPTETTPQPAAPQPAAPPQPSAPPTEMPPSAAPGATAPQTAPPVTAPPVAHSEVTAPLAPNLERVEPPANARTAAWVATGVTALMVGAGVFSVVRMRQESDRANMIWSSGGEAVDWTAASREHDRWFHATLLFGGLTVVSAAVTGVLWSRAQPSYRVAVSPQGAYVGYARSF